MRPWFTTGRPPVKFRSIWTSFDTPTVNRGIEKASCVLQPNTLPKWPKTHLNPLHHLGRSITTAWPKTAPHLDSPSSLYPYRKTPPHENPGSPLSPNPNFHIARRRTLSAAPDKPPRPTAANQSAPHGRPPPPTAEAHSAQSRPSPPPDRAAPPRAWALHPATRFLLRSGQHRQAPPHAIAGRHAKLRSPPPRFAAPPRRSSPFTAPAMDPAAPSPDLPTPTGSRYPRNARTLW